MTTTEEALETAQHAAATAASDRLLERLAERIGAKATIDVVYGAPIVQGGVTVIPVARVRWGFGGGGGRADGPPSGNASGSGGGGGVAADPVGYVEITADGASFRPIRDPYPSPVLVLAAGVAAALVIRAIARMGRR